MNLTDIIASPQGSQAMDALAQRLGLSPEQAQAAAQALIPALSAGLQKATENHGAMGDILGHLTDDTHQASFNGTASPGDAAAAGQSALGTIFGNQEVTDKIAEHAAAASGLSPDMIKAVLPELTSVVIGGISSHMSQSGLSGVVGQLAEAASAGGLGNLLGSLLGGNAATGGSGGLGGLVGGLVGSFLGGSKSPAGNAPLGGIDPATVQAGMDMLGKLFQPGTPVASSLQNEIGQILTKKA